MTENRTGMLGLDDAAKWLGVSRRTIERLIADGILPKIKIRSRSVVALSALEAYVRRHTRRAT